MAKLSRYARGDGSDETTAIQKCFDNNREVEVDEPTGGKFYGFDPERSLEIDSERAVWASYFDRPQFQRVGFYKFARGFTNRNNKAIRNVELRDLWIDGVGREDKFYDDRWNTDDSFSASEGRLSGIGIRLFTNPGEPENSNITLSNIRLDNWPGVGIRTQNGNGLKIHNCLVDNPARGGIIVTMSANEVEILGSKAFNCGDDAIALNAIDGFFPQLAEVRDCVTSHRTLAPFGAGVALRGPRDVEVTGVRARNSENLSFSIEEAPDGAVPTNLYIADCESRGSRGGLRIMANRANKILVERLLVVNPQMAAYVFKSHPDYTHPVDWLNVEVKEREGNTSTQRENRVQVKIT